MGRPLGAGIVGCGNIAGAYAGHLATYDEVALRAVTDVDAERAAAFGREHGVRAHASLEEMLADPEVDVVVNLTSHHVHFDVTRAALEAGKHVHSEKPLAMHTGQARELVALAEERGLRLGCSPATFMGEAQQTVMKAVREGRLGRVRVVYAECNWGRLEVWHPAPEGFYRAGALFDVGVYPLTIATAMFGPAVRVTAFGTVVKPVRTTPDGTGFTVTTPDFVTAAVELADGTVLRLTATFYVPGTSRQSGMEFHGDDGSLVIDSWQDFDTPITHTAFGSAERTAVPPVRPAYRGIEFGRAVQDLAQALEQDRPHRATGRQAAHVVEVLEAVRTSYTTGRAVEVASRFDPPAVMEWAL
jgi:predicted dehydrogenase